MARALIALIMVAVIMMLPTIVESRDCPMVPRGTTFENLLNTTVDLSGGMLNLTSSMVVENTTVANGTLYIRNATVYMINTTLVNITLSGDNSTVYFINSTAVNSTLHMPGMAVVWDNMTCLGCVINTSAREMPVMVNSTLNLFRSFPVIWHDDAINMDIDSITIEILEDDSTTASVRLNTSGNLTLPVETHSVQNGTWKNKTHEYSLIATAHGFRPAMVNVSNTTTLIDLFFHSSRIRISSVMEDRVPFAGESYNITINISSEVWWFNGTVHINNISIPVAIPPRGEVSVRASVSGERVNIEFSDWPVANSASMTVHVPTLPVPELVCHVDSNEIMAGQNVSFYASGFTEYRVNFGDGNISNWTRMPVSHVYVQAGKYYPSIMGRIPGRIQSAWVPCGMITVRPLPPRPELYLIHGGEKRTLHAGDEINITLQPGSGVMGTVSAGMLIIDGHRIDGDAFQFSWTPGVNHTVIAILDDGIATVHIISAIPIPEVIDYSISTEDGVVLNATVSWGWPLWRISTPRGMVEIVGNATLYFPPGNYSGILIPVGHNITGIGLRFNFSISPPPLHTAVYAVVNGSVIENPRRVNLTPGMVAVFFSTYNNTLWIWDNTTFSGQWMNVSSPGTLRVITPGGNMTVVVSYITPAVEETGEENRTTVGHRTGSDWTAYGIISGVIVILAIVLFVFRSRIPAVIMQGKGRFQDIDPRDFVKDDLVILRKGDRTMRKYELLHTTTSSGDEKLEVFAIRRFSSWDGNHWDLDRDIRDTDRQRIVSEARRMIRKDVEHGYEIYVRGYGHLHGEEDNED